MALLGAACTSASHSAPPPSALFTDTSASVYLADRMLHVPTSPLQIHHCSYTDHISRDRPTDLVVGLPGECLWVMGYRAEHLAHRAAFLGPITTIQYAAFQPDIKSWAALRGAVRTGR